MRPPLPRLAVATLFAKDFNFPPSAPFGEMRTLGDQTLENLVGQQGDAESTK